MLDPESSGRSVAPTTNTTREAIKAALAVDGTARADDRIDRANEAATAAVEAAMHRTFRPVTATRWFPWPNPDTRSSTWRLWLNQHELVSVASLSVAGTTIGTSGYYLEPQGSGPPYDRIEINLGSTADGYASGDTHQRAIGITGVFGYRDDRAPAGATAEAVDTTETAVDVTGACAAGTGVGDYLAIGDEWLHVTGRGWLDTGDDLLADQAAAMTDNVVTVTDGTAWAAGENVHVDAETMLVTAVTGNVLTVRRAWDGSTLAAHTTGADLYTSRTLTVERGALGTTAASHSSGATLARHRVPALVEQVTILEALVELGLARAGGATEAGAGSATADASGGGVAGVWDRAMRAHGRHGRFRSVG